MTATLATDHAYGLEPLTPEQADLVAANTGLIGWTLRKKCLGITTGGYDQTDAWQDGWLGLCRAAATHDPDGARPFVRHAIDCIWASITRGRGLYSGRNWRRARGRQDVDRTLPLSLNVARYDRNGEWAELGDTLPAATADPATLAEASDTLDRCVAAGRRACRDATDLAVLAWIVDADDHRPAHALAGPAGMTASAIRNRRLRLIDHMADHRTTTAQG